MRRFWLVTIVSIFFLVPKYMAPGSYIYDENGNPIPDIYWPNHLGIVRAVEVKGTAPMYQIYGPGGQTGYMKQTDFVPNPFHSPSPLGTWIKSTKPKDHAEQVSTKSNIQIVFGQQMDSKSLNSDTIQILDEKHGDSDIGSMFTYRYDAKRRTLYLNFKDPKSDYGSSGGVKVYVSGSVRNLKHQMMQRDYEFSFTIK